MVLCGMGTGVVSADDYSVRNTTNTPSNISIVHSSIYHDGGGHYIDGGCGYVGTATTLKIETAQIAGQLYNNDVTLANTIGSFTKVDEVKDEKGNVTTTAQAGLNQDILGSDAFNASKVEGTSPNGTVIGAINAAYDLLDNGKADTDLGNLTDAGKLAAKKLAQEAITVEGSGYAKVDSNVTEGKTTYTVSVTADGQVADGNTGLVTGETVYNALKNEVGTVNADGTFADFADSDLAGKTTITSAISTVNGKVGATDENGKFTAFKGSDLAEETNVADAVSKVNGKVGETDADGKFNDFKGDNLLAGKTTASSAIAAVSGKMGATGADGKFSDFAGSDIADAESVTGAVKAVNDKVGDTQYASTKYVSAGTSATEAIGALDKGLSDLDGKIGKVGAGAAALAALHPLDYDADDKFSFAAGYGNYAGENAAALGAFYRPNENVMFSVGGTLGTGENMVNAGVSFALGHGAAAGTSKAAMAKKIEAQDEEIADLKAEVAELKAMVRELAAK